MPCAQPRGSKGIAKVRGRPSEDEKQRAYTQSRPTYSTRRFFPSIFPSPTRLFADEEKKKKKRRKRGEKNPLTRPERISLSWRIECHRRMSALYLRSSSPHLVCEVPLATECARIRVYTCVSYTHLRSSFNARTRIRRATQ